jgi:uncharacterized pyridoxamine 5'-phosphate oxidase family protein
MMLDSFYETIGVDFDGTLCENAFPEVGEPKTHIIKYIVRQAERGSKIILLTCRENGTERRLLDEAVRFCELHDIPLHALNENPWNPFPAIYGTTANRKVFAHLYIDDNAVNVADVEKFMKLQSNADCSEG